MDAAGHGHRLHGDDREPAVRLDLFAIRSPTNNGWSKAAIQVAFTIFVLTETWLVPIEGYLVDRSVRDLSCS